MRFPKYLELFILICVSLLCKILYIFFVCGPTPPPPQALMNVLDQCPKIETDIPLVKSYLAQFAARAVIAELVSIAELAHPLENGTHFPLFLLCLQQASKLKDRDWLTEHFQQSKVNMQKMLPGMYFPLNMHNV